MMGFSLSGRFSISYAISRKLKIWGLGSGYGNLNASENKVLGVTFDAWQVSNKHLSSTFRNYGFGLM